jgi:hypothetical protein
LRIFDWSWATVKIARASRMSLIRYILPQK